MDKPMPRSWLWGQQGDLVEGALTFPLLVLVTLALLNFSLAGVASVSASNAANYAARTAAVSQSDPTGVAYWTALSAVQGSIGSYQIQILRADSYAGGQVTVEVGWSVPNFFSGLMPLFGQSAETLDGRAVATFRKEGW
jgi:Flp pilus assembly protein TadG